MPTWGLPTVRDLTSSGSSGSVPEMLGDSVMA